MKSNILKLLLVFLAFSSAVVLVEIGMRITLPKPENLAKLEASTLFLHENKPNAVFTYSSQGQIDHDVVIEFDHEVRLNSYGFRDDEFKVGKEPDTFRIAVLGDSQEEAMQVLLVDTWQKVMAKKLSEEAGIKVETYNFGVSGYGTDQQWLTLREKVWQFSPDMVILAFSPNDVGDTYKNKLMRVNNDKIELVSTKERAGGNFLGKLARETYTYHLIVKASSANEVTKRLVNRIRTKILGFLKEERFFLSDAQLVQGPFEVVASQKTPPVEVLEAWKVIGALVKNMKKQADNHGAKFLITINIPRAQVLPADWELLRDRYKLDPASSSPFEINDVMAKIAQENGIDFYDPRIDAVEWTKGNGILHYLIDAHFNVNGNRFMGTKVAEYIIETKLLEK